VEEDIDEGWMFKTFDTFNLKQKKIEKPIKIEDIEEEGELIKQPVIKSKAKGAF